jgi:hypothetical protein
MGAVKSWVVSVGVAGCMGGCFGEAGHSLTVTQPSAPAGALVVNLDFERETTLDFLTEGGALAERRYYDIGHADPDSPEKKHRFIQDAEPHPETAVAQITEGAGLGGSRGFELEFASDVKTDQHRKERMELYLAHGDKDDALRLGEVMYLGYAMYIDPSLPPPPDHATITQCWQLPPSAESFKTGAHSKTKVVPLWMAYREIDGTHGYTLHVKNEGKPVEGGYKAMSSIAATGTFRPGWNTVIYRFEPNHIHNPKPGRITLWVNTLDEINPTADRRYNWGVTPDDELPAELPETGYIDCFDVRMGIYRPKQPARIRLVFDNIRYGKRFQDVRPVDSLDGILSEKKAGRNQTGESFFEE